MAAQVLSGTGNVTYTNSTGQNVRIVINYLENDSNQYSVTMTFQGVSVGLGRDTIVGKSMAFASGNNNFVGYQAGRGIFGSGQAGAVPTEIALSNGETFSLFCGDPAGMKYNVIIIPEAG